MLLSFVVVLVDCVGLIICDAIVASTRQTWHVPKSKRQAERDGHSRLEFWSAESHDTARKFGYKSLTPGSLAFFFSPVKEYHEYDGGQSYSFLPVFLVRVFFKLGLSY